MKLLERIGKELLFFDGGTGTLLQEKGLPPGELPEVWNITHAQVVQELHEAYLNAGCDMIKTNTFGANRLKFPGNTGFSLEEIITAALDNAEKAIKKQKKNAYIALDISATGKLLKPMGDLEFETCVQIYQEIIALGKDRSDFILIETMGDTYETKAAVLAAKENCGLPVFVTMTFDEKGKLLTGGSVGAAVALLEGLGVNALGVNCGLGPKQMEPVVLELLEFASVPVIVNPNAGLPRSENGRTVFDIGPEEFAHIMRGMAEKGVLLLGGCCGTTPAYIAALKKACEGLPAKPVKKKEKTLVSSYTHCVELGDDPVIIGERINPTGKAKFKEALRTGNVDFILREGILQQENGAHILDVNVGLPEIQEAEWMETAIKELQSVIDIPLQIDTADFETMERAMRIYNGKPLVNSVNGKKEVMEAVFPLVKKYGGVVVGLTLDESGIPTTAQKRVEIAEKIIRCAKRFGIEKKDIVIDVLAMTISSDNTSALTTLNALKLVRQKLGGRTVLGVSNVSFGLPKREVINAAFFTLALEHGLSAGIINPLSEAMMRAYHSYRALFAFDEQCASYLSVYSGQKQEEKKSERELSLFETVVKGMREAAGEAADRECQNREPLCIVNEDLIPALNTVGKRFEEKSLFLPQLLMSAEAAKAAFLVIKEKMAQSGQVQEKKEKVILATVKGDIHDIGKNIVKALLENYSYEVLDLGKDVSPERIVDTAVLEQVRLVGLSALMTTTVSSMEKTIQMLKEKKPDTFIMVGGAVLTQEYADKIGASRYCKDAMASVHYAQQVLK